MLGEQLGTTWEYLPFCAWYIIQQNAFQAFPYCCKFFHIHDWKMCALYIDKTLTLPVHPSIESLVDFISCQCDSATVQAVTVPSRISQAYGSSNSIF